MYHVVLRRPPAPPPLRRTILYAAVQVLLLIFLLRQHISFGGIGFFLIAHLLDALPMRLWPLPLLVTLPPIAVGWQIHKVIANRDWSAVAIILLQITIWPAVLVVIRIVEEQRHQMKHVADELRRAKEELERGAAQAEELAALRERTRLAREMHDSIGHALVVVNVKLEAAQRLYARDSARGAAELDATKALVRETMADLRRSLANLRAPLPDHQDLPLALQRLAEDLRQQIDISYAVAPDLPALPPETTEALWRVAREALMNVARHAESGARLTLERQNGALLLRVADDGVGIKPADLARPGHYGIIGMHERIAALGGTLRVAARPEGGTVVEAQVPVGD